MFSRLHTQITDPEERLRAIAQANSVAKENSSAIGASLLQDWTQFGAPAVFGIAMRLYARTRFTDRMLVHNLVVSNVPGPAVHAGLRGRIDVSVGADIHGSGLNITAMSLQGKLDIGLVACPDLLPDLWEMADEFAVKMEDLLARAVAPAAMPLIMISGFLWQHRLAWACLAAARSRARC